MLIVSLIQLLNHRSIPNLCLLQSPTYRRSRPIDTMVDVLGRPLLLLAG